MFREQFLLAFNSAIFGVCPSSSWSQITARAPASTSAFQETGGDRGEEEYTPFLKGHFPEIAHDISEHIHIATPSLMGG